MNNIDRINGYGQVPAVGQTPGQGAEGRAVVPPVGSSGDQVEISSKARWLSKIAAMPAIRADKVEQIREGLADGSYDIDGKLSEALDRLLEEHT